MDRAAATATKGKRHVLYVRGSAADGYSLACDLGPDEPVTEAEIQLLIHVLGDKIAQLLKAASSACPPSSPPDAA